MNVSYPSAAVPLSAPGPIAVWTTGTTTWSAEAYRRIYERELLARLPDAHIRFVSDLPDDAVAVSERGDLVLSRAARAEESDAPIRGPVVAGDCVPDPLVLLHRLTAPNVARSRIEYLRTTDRYPFLDTVIVEISPSRMGHLTVLGARVKDAVTRGHRIAVVAMAMDGEAMTAELRQFVERTFAPVHVVDEIAFDDRLAAIATSTAVVPLSPALFVAACAFARPSLWCSEASWQRDAGVLPGVECLVREHFDDLLQTPACPSIAEAWCTEADAHFDRMAAQLSGPRTAAPHLEARRSSRVAHLEAAQRLTGRRLADERLRFAERTEGLLAEIATLKQEIARRSALEAALREEMAGAFAHARHAAARGDVDRQRLRQLEAAREALEARNEAMTTEHAAMAGALADLTRERDELRGAVDRFARSRSWRYLAPARAVGQALRRLLGISR